MKKCTKISLLLLLVLVVNSCKYKTSLQEYLVESQEKNGFITIDLPTSFLQFKSEVVSDEVKATLKSIHKINVVALPVKGNQKAFGIEKEILKNIFKNNKKYKTLMFLKAKEMNVYLYYTGKTSSIDEVIAFGYGEEVGVGIARLLGKKMNPAKIRSMINNLKIDRSRLNLEQFSTIFNK
jgi:hypothetical protein